MSAILNRRQFLKHSGTLTTGLLASTSLMSTATLASTPNHWFDISVAQWSFQKEFYAGQMKNVDFPEFCKSKLGISGIDYLSDFFLEVYRNKAFLTDLKKRAQDLDVTNIMIMCHKVGDIGHANKLKRDAIIEDHYRWIEAAHLLGCSMIRVNVRSSGSRQQQKEILTESLTRLCRHGQEYDIAVIVENLWGSDYSYKADFIAELMREVNMPNCGTLPDLNNFRYDDPYSSVATMMPWAKSVSAKSIDFTPRGDEKYIDYNRMVKIVHESGFRGYIGIEYQGCNKGSIEGVSLTKMLLERERAIVGRNL